MRNVLSYLAGAMDSDGTFGIRKSTHGMRNGKQFHPGYTARISLKQVTPEVPQLLHETFGGSLRQVAGATENSKPFWHWEATCLCATKACERLRPFVLVKKRQVDAIVELSTTQDPKYRKASYWFLKDYPQWKQMELITSTEAARILGRSETVVVARAILNGSLIALPYDHSGRPKPRIPRAMVERFALCFSDHGKPVSPPELIAWKESIYQRVREMNKIGIDGTPVYKREGPYALK